MNLHNVHWTGDPPAVGDYFMSAIRPRFGYRIDACRITGGTVLDVKHSRRAVNAGDDDEELRLELQVTKMTASEVPQGAIVHPWKWDKRNRRQV